MRIAIGIATRGRPAILGEVLAEIARQTRQPDRLIICHVDGNDIADLPSWGGDSRTILYKSAERVRTVRVDGSKITLEDADASDADPRVTVTDINAQANQLAHAINRVLRPVAL